MLEHCVSKSYFHYAASCWQKLLYTCRAQYAKNRCLNTVTSTTTTATTITIMLTPNFNVLANKLLSAGNWLGWKPGPTLCCVAGKSTPKCAWRFVIESLWDSYRSDLIPLGSSGKGVRGKPGAAGEAWERFTIGPWAQDGPRHASKNNQKTDPI